MLFDRCHTCEFSRRYVDWHAPLNVKRWRNSSGIDRTWTGVRYCENACECSDCRSSRILSRNVRTCTVLPPCAFLCDRLDWLTGRMPCCKWGKRGVFRRCVFGCERPRRWFEQKFLNIICICEVFPLLKQEKLMIIKCSWRLTYRALQLNYHLE